MTQSYYNEDELPEDYPYDLMFPHSWVDGVRLFPGRDFVNGYLAAELAGNYARGSATRPAERVEVTPGLSYELPVIIGQPEQKGEAEVSTNEKADRIFVGDTCYILESKVLAEIESLKALATKQEGAPQDVAGMREVISNADAFERTRSRFGEMMDNLSKNAVGAAQGQDVEGLVEALRKVAYCDRHSPEITIPGLQEIAYRALSTYTQKALDVEKPVWDSVEQINGGGVVFGKHTLGLTDGLYRFSITKLQDGEADE